MKQDRIKLKMERLYQQYIKVLYRHKNLLEWIELILKINFLVSVVKVLSNSQSAFETS